MVEFNFKYYSKVMANHKIIEFTNLTQGNVTMLEYVRQFDQLSHYVSDRASIKASKAWRFLNGIRPRLAMLHPSFFVKLL